MACSFEAQLAGVGKLRCSSIEVTREAGPGEDGIEIRNGVGGSDKWSLGGLKLLGELSQDTKDFGGFVFRELHELIVGLDGLEGLEENGLTGAAGAVDDTRNASALLRAHWNNEPVVA